MKRSSRNSVIAATSMVGAVLAGLGAQPAQAAPITSGVIQIISPSYGTKGATEFSDGADVQVVTADTTRGVVARSAVINGHSPSFELTPPEGKPLTTGTYRLVGEQTYVRAVPEVKINSEFQSGVLDIIDIQSDPTNGTITRLDAVIDGVGEFRFGEDEPGSVVLGLRTVVFPKTFIDLPKISRKQTVHNTGTQSVTLGAPVISGLSKQSFSVSANSCGTTLAAGATCTYSIDFRPVVKGPAAATLAMRTGSATQVVSLAGSSYLGTTKMSTSGKDLVNKGTTTRAVSSSSRMYALPLHSGWDFFANTRKGNDNIMGVFLDAPGTGAIPVGSRPTTGDLGNGHSVRVTAHSYTCDTKGTENIKQFTLDPVSGLPDAVDATFSQRCVGPAVQTSSLQWQARADAKAPSPVSELTLSATAPRQATWKASPSKDLSYVIARLVQGNGAGATPSTGRTLAVNGGTSAVLPAVPAGQQYSVVLFAVDTSGNVSKARIARFGTPAVAVTTPSSPTITGVIAGSGSVTVTFTPPQNTGNLPITSYEVQVAGDSTKSVTGTSSPITLTGLTPGEPTQVIVYAANNVGQGVSSSRSATVTPTN